MRKISTILLFLLLASSIVLGEISESGEHVLTVEISGAKPNKGQVLLAVYTNEENFLNIPVISMRKPVDNKGRAVFEIPNLDSGILAVSAIYDEDNDGKLKTGFMGIPKELVGFSNAAKGRFGPPGFEKASFTFKGSQTIQIRLGKAKD